MTPKLLLLTTDLLRGGTPNVVKELSLRLRERGHDVEVACLAGMGPVGEELVGAGGRGLTGEVRGGVRVHALGASGPGDWAVAVRLARLIRREGYSHVYSLLMHANAVAAITTPLFRGVKFFQSVQTTQPEPAWHWAVQRRAAGLARRVIVPTASVAATVAARCDVAAEKLVVIPNAVDAAAFDGLGPGGDGAGGVGRVVFRVVFLGRLDPVKRVQDLLAALPLLRARGEFAVHLYGDGADRARLERLVPPGLASHVTFHGAVASAREALQGAEVLVLPSEAEGFGLVLVEAMAAGVPVVASRAPGIVDVVEHGKTGLLFPVGDSAALARCVLRLADDRGLRRALVAAGRETVRRRYAWPAVLDQYERALELGG